MPLREVALFHGGRERGHQYLYRGPPHFCSWLLLAFRTTDLGQKLVAAVVMGLAISGMHYTAMWGTIFTAQGPLHDAQGNASLDQTTLALAVAGITFVILAFASIVSLLERKRAEEALRRARADLAHITRVTTMGELTASLAHEVTQPIAAAATNADACLRWLTGDPPNLEEARASALSIVKDAKRAAEIISRIRQLFQKSPPQRESVDVNEIIREMIALLRSEVTRHSISVRAELAANLPRVMGDRVQLQQVIMNLWLPRTQIRAYRWCSPPRMGCAMMSPNRSIGRV